MISSTKAIVLLFSTVINPAWASQSYNDGSTTQEQYFLNDTNVLCYNLTYTNPLIYYVSNFVLKCVSPHPIHWDVTFNSFTKIETGEEPIPYQVESEWKTCRRINQTEKSLFVPEKYFEIVLRLYEKPQLYSIQSILIKCVNTQTRTKSVSWETNMKSSTVNLYEGMKKTLNSQQSQPLCPNKTILASGASRLEFNCLLQKGTLKKIDTTKPVRYFKCDNWINCEQLAAFKFKKRCPTAWEPFLCDSNAMSCKPYPELVSTDSGIVFCGTQDGSFYLHFFKNHSDDTTKPLYIVSDAESDSLALVSLTKQQINEAVEPNVTNFEFKCSAPKFLALKGFEWTVIYSTSSSTYLSKEFCSTTRFEGRESYVENFICPTIHNESSSEINVTCTVHLQTGKMVQKWASANYLVNAVVSDSPSSSNSSDSPDSSNSSNSLYSPKSSPSNTVVGSPMFNAVVGMAGCFVVLLLVFIFCYCKFRGQNKPTLISAEDVDNFLKGTARTNTLSKPPSAIVLPYEVRLEVPREKIKFEPTLLGKGAFGEVRKGKIGQRCVAIKTVNKAADGQYFLALLSELKIMSFVGKHANIVELVGANTERIRKQDVFLIFEFCENGNVLEYIRARREVFVDQLNLCENANGVHNIDSEVEYENGTSRRLCSEQFVRWAVEIATGMDFIASKNVYHGDLAARNILLTHHLVAKVGDFGLAKDLKDYALYVQRMNCPLPLKWMSIESLRNLEFSIQSDVWSFGITVWEIFSLGSKPYPGVEWNFQAWKRLQDGERMDRPSHATQSIHDILLKCWETQPQDRPTFLELKQMFQHEF